MSPDVIMKKESQQDHHVVKIPKFMSVFSILVLVAFVVFVIVNFSEAEQFALLLSQAEPKWLLLAVLLQIGTYLCAGSIWHQVIRSEKQRVPLGALARLAIEKLSINQLVPTGGIAGNLVVFRTMRRFGLLHGLAMSAVLVDILSFYIAYAVVTFSALLILWSYSDLTPAIRYLVSVFAVILVAVPMSIIWLLTHRNKELPHWLLKVGLIAKVSAAIKSVSPKRVLSPKLLAITSLFNVAIFLLDAGTLWTMMRVTGDSIEPLSAFVAMIIASIAGTISFLPGGIGGFEVGSVAALTLLGAPVEAALTGTLLLRGLTLWLPLIPGLFLASQEVNIKL